MASRHPLGQLIEQRMDTLGLRQSEAVRYMAANGVDRSTSWLSGILKRPVRAIEPDAIDSLTRGLGIPVNLVVTAYLESIGVELVNDLRPASLEDAIRSDPRLSADEQELLVEMVEASARRKRARGVLPDESHGAGEGPGTP